MGCCESTAGRASALQLPPPSPTSGQIKGAPAAEVEEKVKEVLCETPAASKPIPQPAVTLKPQEPLQNHGPPPPKVSPIKPPPPAVPAASENSMLVPGASAVRGLSERASKTAANPAGDGGVQRRAETSPAKLRPPRARSLSGELCASTGRGPGKSPTRIRPDGIGGSVRIVQSREAAWVHRLDPGEGSGRRSGPGSPVKRFNGGTRPTTTRVPSTRRTDLSPGRVRRDPNGSSKRMNGGDPKQRQSKGRESLESPLVSLECFIFL